MDVEEKIAESNCKSYEWELYKLVNARTEHLHTRWIDNYRIFLSFNAVLGAAVTAIFGLLIKEDSNVLRVVLLSLCVFGILATCQGLGLILRVHIEMKLRIDELLRLERMISQLPIRIYEEGRQFLYENKDVGNVLQKENPRKGIRGTDAYRRISQYIIGYYVIVVLCVLWPWFQPLLPRICRVLLKF